MGLCAMLWWTFTSLKNDITKCDDVNREGHSQYCCNVNRSAIVVGREKSCEKTPTQKFVCPKPYPWLFLYIRKYLAMTYMYAMM